MFKTAKCPHCGQVPAKIIAEAIDVQVPLGNAWHGLSYSCGSCRTILSVGIDPVALKTDTVAEIEKLLKRRG